MLFFYFLSQSILKVNGSCDKTRNVSFSNVESEVIGYGGEEYSTDEEYSSDDESQSTDFVETSGDDEELRRLTEANTNINGKLILPEPKAAAQPKSTPAKPVKKSPSPPLVVVQSFADEPPKSLVFNFLKNKEIAAAAATATAAAVEAKNVEKKDCIEYGTAVVQLRTKSTETGKKPTLTRNSLLTANSNEQFLNIKRSSLQPDEQAQEAQPTVNKEIPKVKLHPPEIAKTDDEKRTEETEIPVPPKDSDADTAGSAPYKTRSNVPRMGTMHFKLKLAQKPEPPKPAVVSVAAVPNDATPDSSLTSREMAGEPDGKADSDEPGDPTTAALINRSSFLHNYKGTTTKAETNYKASSSLLREPITPPRTPPKKVNIYLECYDKRDIYI